MRRVRGKGHKFGQARLSVLCISADRHVDGCMGSARLTARPSGSGPEPVSHSSGLAPRSSPPAPSCSPPLPMQFPEVDTRWRCEDREGEKPVPSHEEEDAADGQIG